MQVKDMTLGIVGFGSLGRTTAKGFTELVKDIKIQDIDEKLKNTKSVSELSECDILFICLPTELTSDHSIHRFIEIVSYYVSNLVNQPNFQFKRQVLAIRSTTVPGTTRKISEKIRPTIPSQGLSVIHYPEFFTERCSDIDFFCCDNHIIGLTNIQDINESNELFYNLLRERQPNCNIYNVSSEESELIKLSINTFFSIKVTFFNLIKQICDKNTGKRYNYDRIIRGILSDYRIAPSHFKVPGPDSMHGFGGKCLPKDTRMFMKVLEDNKIPTSIINEILNYNEQIREIKR